MSLQWRGVLCKFKAEGAHGPLSPPELPFSEDTMAGSTLIVTGWVVTNSTSPSLSVICCRSWWLPNTSRPWLGESSAG